MKPKIILFFLFYLIFSITLLQAIEEFRIDCSTLSTYTPVTPNWNNIPFADANAPINPPINAPIPLIHFSDGSPSTADYTGNSWTFEVFDPLLTWTYPPIWVVQEAGRDAFANFGPAQSIISGLFESSYTIEVLSATNMAGAVFENIFVNGMPANRTYLNVFPVPSPWNTYGHATLPGDWLIWDFMVPAGGQIVIDIFPVEEGVVLNAIRILGNDDPLPVTLSTFEANYINSITQLSWTTQSESNNLGWNVYRSLTSSIENGSICNDDIIDGAGTTSTPTTYIFDDPHEIVTGTQYWYWIESISISGQNTFYNPISFIAPEQDDDEDTPEIPTSFGLNQNYPNPFNPSTTISFTSNAPGDYSLTIFDVKGRRIRELYSGSIEAEKHYEFIWDGKDELDKLVGSGIYFYKLTSDNKSETKKMIMMK